MAYQIDRYNRTLLTVVEDGTLDETTDLRFIGKNFAGYGEIHNENFLYLLENFSSASPPPKPLSGQVWFDSSLSKLKFYDGSIWRTTGGSEVSGTQPAGLTVGDFWWDQSNDQLYVFNGTSFVLIGPQDAGAGTTQLVSQTIIDTANNNRSIIVGFVNDNPIFVVSPNQFTILNQPDNLLQGFTEIRRGITLKDTPNTGFTSTSFRFWGTASAAETLVDYQANPVVAYTASDFITKTNPVFPNQITSNNGIAITPALVLGTDTSNTVGIIRNNEDSGIIRFIANNSIGNAITSIEVTSDGLLPGYVPSTPGDMSSSNVPTYDLGSQTRRFKNIWAQNITGTASKADTLLLSGTTYLSLSVNAVANTVVARSSNNTIFANEFNGTATSAKYADLAENYTTDKEYPIGTIMAVGGDAETTAANASDVAIGVISEKPAYLMNADLDGQAIALKGRVPVRVSGTVAKGQAIYAMSDGVGTTLRSTAFVGIALEGSTSADENLIECVLKV